MAQPVIQTSFASGEWAPKLRSRVDIAKYHAGAALLRNFFVDYSGGGASTRQGTKFLAQVGANGARLIPFQASTTISYVLEFGQNYIRFFTNGAQVTTAPNTPYQISSPYNASDLFPNPATGNPGLKFVQDASSLIICHPSYAPQILTIASATSWSLTTINFGSTIATPTNLALVSSDSSGTTWYSAYLVTAVDANGQESAPPSPATFAGANQLSSTAMSFTLSWNAVPGAASYNVYKASQSYKSAVAAGAQYGFISNVTGTSFIDSEPGIAPDFSQTPPVEENPFQGAGVQSYTVTAAGNYTTVPIITVAAGAGATATAVASLAVTAIASIASGGSFFSDPKGQTFTFSSGPSYGVVLKCTASTLSFTWSATAFAIISAGSLTGVGTPAPTDPILVGPTGSAPAQVNITWGLATVIGVSPGSGYTSAPAVTVSGGGGGSATATLAMASAGNPGVPGFLQERLWLAAQPQAVQTMNISQPGSFFNFNTSNPTENDDAIQATIISEELNDIRSLVSVPNGMIALTGKGAWLINGTGTQYGAQGVPVTPTNISASPQAFNGTNDVKPIKVNFDVLYITNKGNYVRDLSYNLYAQIYTGADISVLSNHLFFNYFISDWAWAEEPFKTLWAVRNDGVLLSLGFVKEQELIGWAHHDTNGQFLSVCSVIETVENGDVVDAVYVIVQRVVNGTTVQYVERMADRYFTHGWIDSWSVDCGLRTVPNSQPAGALTVTGNVSTVGNSVTLTDTADAPFTSAMATNSWRVDSNDGAVYQITTFTSTSVVTASVIRPPNFYNLYTNSAFVSAGGGTWSVWQPVTTVSGLTQLENMSVVGVADGTAIGPLTVSNIGTVTLPSAASKVTLGLQFTPQLQTLNLDLGEPTIQSKRKKLPAATIRVADTLGLQIGTGIANVVTMKDTQLGAIPSQSNGPAKVQDLYSGDSYTTLDQLWQEPGQLSIQQNLPFPATILGVMPQVVLGDTGRPGQ